MQLLTLETLHPGKKISAGCTLNQTIVSPHPLPTNPWWQQFLESSLPPGGHACVTAWASSRQTRRTSTSSAPQCNQPRWRAQIPHLQSGSAAQGFGGFPWPNIIICQMKGDTQSTAKREPLEISMPLLAEAIQCKWWRHPLWAATCTTHQVVATL